MNNENRIVLFYDPAFPYNGARPELAELTQQFGEAAIVTADGLEDALRSSDAGTTFINLHGPYLVKKAWPAILAFFRRGGGLLHSGGVPFRTPVREVDGKWQPEHEQTAYHQALNIHEALPISAPPHVKLAALADIPQLQGFEGLFEVADTYGLVLHVTKAADIPAELGSGGPMDAHIYPLLKTVTEQGRELSAPVVLLENTKGQFSGSRWLLVNQELSEAFWTGGGSAALAEWARFTSQGVTELWLKPNYACYELGEMPVLTLQAQSLDRGAGAAEWQAQLQVFLEKRGGGRELVHQDTFRFEAGEITSYIRKSLPLTAEAGYYSVEAVLRSESGESRVLKQGFWGRDEEWLQEGEMLTCGRDYFFKDGKPFPVVGMTYMTSDVARKFLQLPNAAVWDRDMAQMSGAGINLIRTGIWTAIRTMGFIDGHVSEDILRAIDAFILTAKRHNLELTFNFFAFTPELWEGLNPYLDPRSLEAQKRFITAVVSRHKDSAHVHWDLINEPSMFDPKRLWSPNTLRDPFETAAFRKWLKERHHTIEELQEKWNMTPERLPSFESIQPPQQEEVAFNTTEVTPKLAGPWLDYVLFSMEMHNQWAAELRRAIQLVQPKQLVTVGQDEGLGSQRPSPLFYADAVDYTTVHSWWLMDQLVWDGIFTKSPYKPNLIQETGIMYVETPDGRAKRSEEELRNILERKYAYSFSTGGAGAVQWIWNINFYMDNVNESNIGALRADGTEKPEADVSYDFGAFMRDAGPGMIGRKLEETVVIFPYSNDFSNRPFAGEGTSRLTRTLAHRMNVPFRAMGEYHLEALSDPEQELPKLIIVPSAHNLSGEALDKLVTHVAANGGTLLVTGPLSLDEYWRPVSRASSLVGESKLANVRREEALLVEGRLLPVSFGGSGIAKLNKELLAQDREANAGGAAGAVGATGANGAADAMGAAAVYVNGPSKLVERELGKGKLIWCPLPLELNESYEVLETVYRYALAEAGVAQELEWLRGGDLPGVYGRKLTFDESSLFIFVSEYGVPCDVEVKDSATGRTYRFELEAERTVMFAAGKDGELTAVYRPSEVKVAAAVVK
ncbi:beta-galactosidase [Paenibacillus sp. GCM10023252]|uniref:beta-galactosidase n=1 Tax=Paenibacillus sp. GCM10023252 TaxID=3252649 RepID=UPI0036167A2E